MVKKRRIPFIFAMSLLGVSIISFLLWCFISMLFSIPKHQIEHYENDENYQEVACMFMENGTFEEIPGHEDKRYNRLSLWQEAQKLVEETTFFIDVNAGDIVYVIATSGYFWDSYSRPVVALLTNDLVYLTFTDGKEALLNELMTMRRRYLKYAVPVISISISSLAIALGLITYLIIDKKRTTKKVVNS